MSFQNSSMVNTALGTCTPLYDASGKNILFTVSLPPFNYVTEVLLYREVFFLFRDGKYCEVSGYSHHEL